MSEKREDCKVTRKNKKKTVGKIDFKIFYAELSGENPLLKANESFWVTKGNSQKYFCSLCNIGVQFSTNLHVFKSAILAHVQDKNHKKRYDNFVAKESAPSSVDKPMVNVKGEEKSLDTIDDKATMLCCKRKNPLRAPMRSLKKEENTDWRDKSITLVDLDLIYTSFEKVNPVVKASRKFIEKSENGRDFFCNLCKVLILNSLSAVEFRYNLFVHLNEESHWSRLPNFSEIKKDFDELMSNFAATLPASYKNELKCFELGPVFRFVKCSLCDVAVSCNLHRLEKHLKYVSHKEKKQASLKGEPVKVESLSHRTRQAFKMLVVQLDPQFKKDVKYIHIGKIPGYTLCSLCSYVILPTKFYMETHLGSAVHKNNKTDYSPINRKSRFEITLESLLETLPEDMRGYNFFKESACGLICQRCDTTIPCTSYDLYTHINKERLAVVEA